MKRAALLVPIAIVLSCPAARASFTVPDAVFWGSVRIEGNAAPAGTLVSGRVAGVELASHELGSDPDDRDRYTLNMPMSHPDSFFAVPLAGTAFPGTSVQIFIDGNLVVERVLETGVITRLDLNDTGSPPPTFTATATLPTPTVTPTRPGGSSTRAPTVTRTSNQTPGGATPTGTGVATGSPSATGSTTPSPSPTPTPDGEALCIQPCSGDCNANCRVAINELITLVDISLTKGSVDACLAGDGNADERINIAELVTAVNRALNGCPLASGD